MSGRSQSRKYELIGDGTVEMVLPVIQSFLGSQKYHGSSEPGSTAMRTLLRIAGPQPIGNYGYIELQQLPHERILITFDWSLRRLGIGEFEAPGQAFTDLVIALLVRLDELGFVTMPDAPND